MKRQLALVLCFAAAGCSPEVSFRRKAEEGVRAQLRDPDSAKFSNGYINAKGDRTYCGTVNSANEFGGMTGPRSFYYTEHEGAQLPPDISIALPISGLGGLDKDGSDFYARRQRRCSV